jgi:hypothetical protein
VVNQPIEQCDGTDTAACPGTCRADCTCPPTPPVGIVDADVSVREKQPDQSFGTDMLLWVDASAAKLTFLRVHVSGIGTQQFAAAHLRLQVADVRNASSESGGRINAMTDCGWDELTTTWNTQPAIDGAVLGEVGAVQRNDVVTFDLTNAITGDGTYCFALDSLSSDGVTYYSTEAALGQPEMEIFINDSGVPICGDDQINQPIEECDGTDDAVCPGACLPTCNCPPPSACGDGQINQTTEVCDGNDDALCPGVCRFDCTCPPPPACGDHRVNLPTEECDGPDDIACPARCQGDCTCDGTRPVAIIEADVMVREDDPDQNFGERSPFWLDDKTAKRTFIRVRMRGIGTQQILGARLQLQVADAVNAESDSGGRIHAITHCGWDELAVTWNTQPAIDGTVLDAVGAVQRAEVVIFDVTQAITGDGTYCFALDSLSSNGVQFNSREAIAGRPTVEIVVPGVCGDRQVNQPTEGCDGFDDAACTAACLPDCTCATCGNNVAEPPVETCDGTDDAACPGACNTDCTCPLSPPPAFACLRTGGPSVALTGTFLDAYANDSLEPGTVLDARSATFLAWPETNHPLNLAGGSGVCVAGGTVLGQYDRAHSWNLMHDFNTVGIAFENDQLTVDGLRVDNTPDGIRPRGTGTFTVRNAWLSYVRDDCIENDHLQAGLVEDSLFDGCYVGFSARPSENTIQNGVDGSGNVWTIRSSLIRLAPMPDPVGGDDDGLGHGGFFKWHLWNHPTSSLSPKLALYDNVFMAERVGQVGGNRMGTPPGQIGDCQNNVMVWLGPGDFPGVLPDCFTVTTDPMVWDDAVADWLERHPQIGR